MVIPADTEPWVVPQVQSCGALHRHRVMGAPCRCRAGECMLTFTLGAVLRAPTLLCSLGTLKADGVVECREVPKADKRKSRDHSGQGTGHQLSRRRSNP